MLAVNDSNMLPDTNPTSKKLINFEDSIKLSGQNKMIAR